MAAELVTKCGDKIRVAVESIKDFGTESIIVFRQAGVEIIGVEHAGVVDVRFCMPLSKIVQDGGTYSYCGAEEYIALGMLTKTLAAALKRSAGCDSLTVGVRKGQQRELYVSVKNGSKTFCSEIVTLAPAPAALEMALRCPWNLKTTASLASGSFHVIIGDLVTSDPVVIAIEDDGSGNGLRFSGEGQFSKSSVNTKGDGDEDTEEEEGELYDPEAELRQAVKTSFATSHLQKISKAKNIGPTISIGLQQGMPGLFQYSTPIGTMSYVVSAREAGDIDDPRRRGVPLPGAAIAEPPKKRARPDAEAGDDDFNF